MRASAVFGACLLLWSANVSAAETPRADPGELSLSLANELFIANYEYFDIPYRQGESVLGNVVEARVGYVDSDKLAFYAGGVVRKPFNGEGAERGYPLLTIAFRPDPTTSGEWLFGSLPRRHGFVRQIYEPLQEFLRPHLDGLQYGSDSLTAFMNWDLFDTEDHPERFSANGLWHTRLDRFTLLSQARWTHQGGQLHEHPDVGIVHDRIGMLGVHVRLFDAGAWRAELQQEGFGNIYSSSVNSSLNKKGWGSASRLEIGTPGPDIAFESWSSEKFYTADGDPLYQANEIRSLIVFKSVELVEKRLHLQAEARGQWFEQTFAHSQLLRVNLTLDRMIRTRAGVTGG